MYIIFNFYFFKEILKHVFGQARSVAFTRHAATTATPLLPTVIREFPNHLKMTTVVKNSPEFKLTVVKHYPCHLI